MVIWAAPIALRRIVEEMRKLPKQSKRESRRVYAKQCS